MLTQEDKAFLAKKGISEEKLNAQLNCFKTGFPWLKLAGAASPGNGITIPSDGEYLYDHIPDAALEFTLFYDERQNLTLRDLQGRFLAATPTGDLILTDKPVEDNYQFWRLIENESGWYIINEGAANNQTLQYSDGTFSIKTCTNTKEFVFNFYEVG